MPPFADQPSIAKILREACSPGVTPPDRAMARNLLCEHRLSAERFDAFSGFAGQLTAMDRVQQALEEYQTGEVRPLITSGLQPAYARAANANNAVSLPAGSHVGAVLDLTRLGRVYAEAKATFKLPEFRSYAVTDPRDYSQVNDFLTERLNDPADRDPFLKALFRACARYRKRIEEQVHPVWAAEWESLRPFLDPDKPARWLRAVGVPREHAVWLAVVRYPVANRKRTIKLFRPTQLDAGWYAHHFPSPPQAALVSGGHTMFLGETGHAGEDPVNHLVSEFLHAQTDFTIGDWRRGGRLVAFTHQAVTGTLEEQRKVHWLLLQSFYGAVGVCGWMPERT